MPDPKPWLHVRLRCGYSRDRRDHEQLHELGRSSPGLSKPPYRRGTFRDVPRPLYLDQDGEAVLALGTPGSYGISQTQAQALVHHLDFGLDLQAAIDAPRARLWDGAKVNLEARIEEPVIAELKKRGHEIEMTTAFSMLCGGMHAIRRDPKNGTLAGAADSRRDGAAIAI